MEDATWLALTLVLTLLGGGWTWYAARNRGLRPAVRGAALTLIPPAAWLTGTLEAGVKIADVVVDWATDLVFSPSVWAGLVLLGLSGILFVVAGRLPARGARPATDAPGERRALPRPDGRGAPAIDDDLAEIEAILKKRGIS